MKKLVLYIIVVLLSIPVWAGDFDDEMDPPKRNIISIHENRYYKIEQLNRPQYGTLVLYNNSEVLVKTVVEVIVTQNGIEQSAIKTFDSSVDVGSKVSTEGHMLHNSWHFVRVSFIEKETGDVLFTTVVKNPPRNTNGGCFIQALN